MGWFKRLKAAITDSNTVTASGTTVNQQNNVAGGMVVRGDMCGGDYVVRGKPEIMPGTYIGGNLQLVATCTPLKVVADIDFEVNGKVFYNGVDVTDEFRQLRRPN